MSVALSAGKPGAHAPLGWRWHRLTDLARLETGHTPSRNHPEWWVGTIPWISLADIRELDGKVAQDTLEHTNDEGIANSSARLLPEGTVVLSRTASVGFVTILGRPMATSQDFVNWVCGPELDPHFLSYLLRASRAYIRSLSSGAIHQTVYMPTVESFHVNVPALSRQREISASLNEQLLAMGRARAAADARLGVVSAMPGAFLRSMFRNAEAENWPLRRLVDFADIAGGLQKTPDRAPGRNAVPYLTVRNVQRGSLDLSRIEKFEVTPAELSRLRLLDDDILIVEGNGSADQIGRNALFRRGMGPGSTRTISFGCDFEERQHYLSS